MKIFHIKMESCFALNWKNERDLLSRFKFEEEFLCRRTGYNLLCSESTTEEYGLLNIIKIFFGNAIFLVVKSSNQEQFNNTKKDFSYLVHSKTIDEIVLNNEPVDIARLGSSEIDTLLDVDSENSDN